MWSMNTTVISDGLVTFVSRRLQEIMTEALNDLKTGTLDQRKFLMYPVERAGTDVTAFIPALTSGHHGDIFVSPFVLTEYFPRDVNNDDDLQAMSHAKPLGQMFEELDDFLTANSGLQYSDGEGGTSEYFDLAYLSLWVKMMELDHMLVGYVVGNTEGGIQTSMEERAIHLFLRRDARNKEEVTCHWQLQIISPKGKYTSYDKEENIDPAIEAVRELLREDLRTLNFTLAGRRLTLERLKEEQPDQVERIAEIEDQISTLRSKIIDVENELLRS